MPFPALQDSGVPCKLHAMPFEGRGVPYKHYVASRAIVPGPDKLIHGNKIGRRASLYVGGESVLQVRGPVLSPADSSSLLHAKYLPCARLPGGR